MQIDIQAENAITCQGILKGLMESGHCAVHLLTSVWF